MSVLGEVRGGGGPKRGAGRSAGIAREAGEEMSGGGRRGTVGGPA
jgi:hypothetical protein